MTDHSLPPDRSEKKPPTRRPAVREVRWAASGRVGLPVGEYMRIFRADNWRLGRCGCGERCGHYRFGPLIIWILGRAR